jgi:hypothetical protein
MSLLTDEYVIIDKAGDMHRGRLSKGSRDVIKDKLINIIGKDEAAFGYQNEAHDVSEDDYVIIGRNQIRAELRQKVKEL